MSSSIQKSGEAAKIGINTHDWVPQKLTSHIPMLRLYMWLEWIWTPEGLAVNPMERDDLNLDKLLQQYKSSGQCAHLCLHRKPKWFSADAQARDWADYPLSNPNENPESPFAYTEYAKFLFNLSARYGRKTHSVSSLRVDKTPRYSNAPVNHEASGLDLLEYIAPENEPNRNWRDIKAQYTPEQFAAMLSAAYDGHCGELGENMGIKAGDPTMKVVMPSLAQADLGFLYIAHDWWIKNRKDSRIPADVLAFNWYANTHSNDLHAVNNPGRALHPEDSRADLYRLSWKLKAQASNIFGGLPVWLTEFGYDTVPPSKQAAIPENGDWSMAEKTQSDWIVRSYLEMIAAGIDGAFLYNSIDDWNAHDGGIYQSCGIMKGANPQDNSMPYSAKPSYKALADLTAFLKGKKIVSYERGYDKWQDVRIVSLKDRFGRKSAIYWNATGNGSKGAAKIFGKEVLVTETPQYAKSLIPGLPPSITEQYKPAF